MACMFVVVAAAAVGLMTPIHRHTPRALSTHVRRAMAAAIRIRALYRRLRSRRSFEQPLVPCAICRPRHGVEAFRIDRPPINQALSISSVLDSSQGGLDLLQHRGVKFRFGEVLAFGLVSDAQIAGIRSSVD